MPTDASKRSLAMRFSSVALPLLIAISAAGAARASPDGADRPLVGAIRWDAWQEDGRVRAAVETSLGPRRWHHRLPLFARATGPDAVAIDGNTQAIVDREIAYAAGAGIDYWAFCTYPDDSGMSNGLHRYLASEARRRVRFCLLLQGFREALRRPDAG